MSSEWVLYYWAGFPGRGEFVRLIFEEAGEKYTEENSGEVIMSEIIQGKGDGYPMFAPPLIKKGNFKLTQCHAICRYLGEEFGLSPDTKEENALAEQLSITCHDYIAEGRLAFHGIDPTASYSTQKEETKPYLERFIKTRMPRWLTYFERALKFNNDGKGFVIGNKCTYVDLTLFHILRATEAQFPEQWAKADYIPALKAFKDRIAARPKIAEYLKSNRCKAFAGDSMM